MRPIAHARLRAAALCLGGLACAWAAAAAPARHRGPQVGRASYFGADQAGKRTATGRPANPNALTAASRTLPLGSTAQVTNLQTGRSVRVKVVDRGPYAKRRIMDVSAKAARKLGMQRRGVAAVKVQPLHEAAR